MGSGSGRSIAFWQPWADSSDSRSPSSSSRKGRSSPPSWAAKALEHPTFSDFGVFVVPSPARVGPADVCPVATPPKPLNPLRVKLPTAAVSARRFENVGDTVVGSSGIIHERSNGVRSQCWASVSETTVPPWESPGGACPPEPPPCRASPPVPPPRQAPAAPHLPPTAMAAACCFGGAAPAEGGVTPYRLLSPSTAAAEEPRAPGSQTTQSVVLDVDVHEDPDVAIMREFTKAANRLSLDELKEFVEDHVSGELASIRKLPCEQRAQAFRSLCAEWHPDKCPAIPVLATEVFQKLQAAKYSVLGVYQSPQ